MPSDAQTVVSAPAPTAGKGRVSASPTEAHTQRLGAIKAISAELFYRTGYAATDMRSIASAADMHVSSLYNYVTGKEELLYLIVLDGMNAITRSFEAAVARSGDPIQRLALAIESHLLHHLDRRHVAWTCHIEWQSLTGDYRTRVRSLRHQYERAWRALIQEGIDAGVLVRTDPTIATLGILPVGQTLSRWYDPTSSLTPREIVPPLVQQLLCGLAVRPVVVRGTHYELMVQRDDE